MTISSVFKFLSAAFVFAASMSQPAWSAENYEPEVLIVVEGGDAAKYLCGVNCLFVGISLLSSDKAVPLDELLKQFPLVEKEGTSLLELKEVAENKFQLRTKLARYNDAEIAKLSAKQVALVLLEGKPISHIVLKRPYNGGVQVLNPPTEPPYFISADKFAKEQNLVLILSTEPLMPSTTKIISWGGIILGVISLFVFGTTIKFRNGKKKGENGDAVVIPEKTS